MNASEFETPSTFTIADRVRLNRIEEDLEQIKRELGSIKRYFLLGVLGFLTWLATEVAENIDINLTQSQGAETFEAE